MSNKADYFTRHFDEVCLTRVARNFITRTFKPTLDCAASERNSVAEKFVSWEVNFLLMDNSCVDSDARVFLHPPTTYHLCVAMLNKFLLLPNKKALVLTASFCDLFYNILKSHDFMQVTLDSDVCFCKLKYCTLEEQPLKVPEKYYFLYQN